MKIRAATARRFSESLLSIYASETETALAQAWADAEAGWGEGEAVGWLTGLLQRHAEHRRAQLSGDQTTKSLRLPQLTRREQEVLQRIALGETDAAIGGVLGISPKTASKHVENILRKLGVETRTAAAVLAARQEA